jgi:hypothetical protein
MILMHVGHVNGLPNRYFIGRLRRDNPQIMLDVIRAQLE